MQLSVLRPVGTISGYGCCGVLVVGILVDKSVGGGGGVTVFPLETSGSTLGCHIIV